MSNIIRFDRSSASETNNEQSEPEPSDPEPSGLRLLPSSEQISSSEFEEPDQETIESIVSVIKEVTDAHAQKRKREQWTFHRDATVAIPDLPEAVAELSQYGFFDKDNHAARDYYLRNPDSNVAAVTIRASKSMAKETPVEELWREVYKIEEHHSGALELRFCKVSESFEKHEPRVYSPVSKEDSAKLLALLESLRVE